MNDTLIILWRPVCRWVEILHLRNMMRLMKSSCSVKIWKNSVVLPQILWNKHFHAFLIFIKLRIHLSLWMLQSQLRIYNFWLVRPLIFIYSSMSYFRLVCIFNWTHKFWWDFNLRSLYVLIFIYVNNKEVINSWRMTSALILA